MSTNNILNDFEAWQNTLFQTLVKATKAANAIPANDVSFYRTLDRDFASKMEEASVSTLHLCNGLLRQASAGEAERLNDGDDIKERFEIVVDVIDNMLEKVDVAIDEIKMPRKKGSTGLAQSAPVVAVLKHNDRELKFIHASNIARPQLQFPDAVDNSSRPFMRKINYKPNAKVDLSYGMDSETLVQPHPYEYEITHLEYPEHMFEQRPEQLYHPFDSTTHIYVDTEEALKDMCKSLEMQREIAIDLEHHSYRTYQGFTCLMQVSTRDQDYIVDTLELRGSLHLLNQSFTDPNIVKVLHGAESDIIWLQRDLGVYIVNMFDTYHASKVLEFGAHSLAHLLKLYADFDADKKFQRDDWRVRPLPKDMLAYARADTHFLLYIYDRMRNALLDNSRPGSHNLLDVTLKRSSETSLKVHEKENYDAEEGDGSNGWRKMYSKWNRSFNDQQFAVFKALHAWRDQLARDEDESLQYVLPNHMLFTMADKMPEEAAGVLACCGPIPPPVRMNATDIAFLISRTKASVKPKVGGFKKVEIKEPVHVRFDPATGLQPTEQGLQAEQESRNSTARTATAPGLSPLEKAQQSTRGKVQVASSSGIFGKSSVSKSDSKPLADASSLMAKTSGLFGALPVSHTSRAEEDALNTARRIMHELSLQPVEEAPVFMDISSVQELNKAAKEAAEAESRKAAEEELLFTPQEERATKQKRTDVLVLSNMSKKRSRALDEDRAELVESSAAPSATSSDVEGGGAQEEAVVVKKKKSKKEKGAVTLLSTPGSEVAVPEAFQPFDYNSVRSVVDETIDSQTMSKKRQKKKKNNGPAENEPAAPFDPYNKLVEDAEFKKKDAAFSRNPKSGARSMTFGKK
ncbi:exosome nuclease subunit [Gryganskiella cystojenkinii]|nr:exosome nuclease subunit [Gryganskiella cystojenkinii]